MGKVSIIQDIFKRDWKWCKGSTRKEWPRYRRECFFLPFNSFSFCYLFRFIHQRSASVKHLKFVEQRLLSLSQFFFCNFVFTTRDFRLFLYYYSRSIIQRANPILVEILSRTPFVVLTGIPGEFPTFRKGEGFIFPAIGGTNPASQ